MSLLRPSQYRLTGLGRRLLSGSSNSSSKNGFFKKFAEGIKGQAQDDDLKTSVKRFEETLTEIKELESVKKAKEVIAKAKEDNEALLAEVKGKVNVARDAASKVSEKVGDTLATAAKPIKIIGDTMRPYMPNIAESELAQKLGKKVSETEENLLEGTSAYRYGGYKDRAARDRAKSRAEKSASGEGSSAEQHMDQESVPENPDAGESVVLHKSSKLGQLWSDWKDNSSMLRGFQTLKQRYDESNNVLVFFLREATQSVTGRFSSVFAENETARAMREIRKRDPSFSMDKFLIDAHEFLIPEILDALLAGDLPTLRTWCSESTFNMLKATFDAQLKAGHRMEGRVLDLRHIEVMAAKVLDDTPVIVVSFTTQQVSYVRDAEGAVVEGKEDDIANVTYVMALAKEETKSSTASSPTRGWKLLEIAIRPGAGW